MRPTSKILMGLALALALLLAPLAVGSVAFAQSTAVQCFGPVTNSVICSYTSTSQTTDGSPGSGSAQTIVNATLSTAFLTGQPVKMRVDGRLVTKSASGTRAWTLATSWGGNSLTLFSSLTLTAERDSPFWIECDLVTTSSTAGSLAKALACEAGYISVAATTTGATQVITRERTTFTFSATPTQAVTVSSTLSSTAGLGLVVDRVQWMQGL